MNSELDHTIAYAHGGDTSDVNLYSACGRHHHLKHDAPGWSVLQHPDGQITWTTPTGRTYTTNPHDYRPDDGPDPTAYILREAERRRTRRPERPPPSTTDDEPPPF